MSGPVSPPLATTESGTSTIVRPTNTLEFNGADFTVTGSGSKATISIDSSGAGAALTATQIGFGNASNLLTGDADFTFIADTGAGPEVKLQGNNPVISMNDEGGTFEWKTKLEQAASTWNIFNCASDSTRKLQSTESSLTTTSDCLILNTFLRLACLMILKLK